jgi:hypothetical protein
VASIQFIKQLLKGLIRIYKYCFSGHFGLSTRTKYFDAGVFQYTLYNVCIFINMKPKF